MRSTSPFHAARLALPLVAVVTAGCSSSGTQVGSDGGTYSSANGNASAGGGQEPSSGGGTVDDDAGATATPSAGDDAGAPATEDAALDAPPPGDAAAADAALDAGPDAAQDAEADAPLDAGPLVNGCTPAEFTLHDESGANGVRVITFGVAAPATPYDPNCMRVAKGQTVMWKGDFKLFPLEPEGGTTPTPIKKTDKGDAVTFTFDAAGTYGFDSEAQPKVMFGAIDVVP